jgi:hypothetical protein
MFGQGNPAARMPHSVPHALLRGDDTSVDDSDHRANIFFCGEGRHLEETAWEGTDWFDRDHRSQIQGDPILLVRGTPTSVDPGDVRVNLFAVGQDRRLYHHFQQEHGWRTNQVGSDLEPPVFAVGQGDFGSLDPAGVKAHVFACRRADHHLQQAFWDGTKWIYHDHSAAHGRPVQPGMTALGLGDFSTGNPEDCWLFLFMRQMDGSLVDLRWDGHHWLWHDHAGHLCNYAPDMMVQGDLSRLDPSGMVARLFTVNSDKVLMERQWNGTAWEWIAHPGRQVDGPPLVVARGDTKSTLRGKVCIHVFVRSVTGELLERYFDGEDWSWNDRGGNITDTQLEATGHGDFSSTDDSHSQMRIFAHGSDGRLIEYLRAADPPGSWSMRSLGENLTPDLVPPLLYGDRTSRDARDVRIKMFAVGDDEQLHEFDWTGTDWVTGMVH